MHKMEEINYIVGNIETSPMIVEWSQDFTDALFKMSPLELINLLSSYDSYVNGVAGVIEELQEENGEDFEYEGDFPTTLEEFYINTGKGLLDDMRERGVFKSAEGDA